VVSRLTLIREVSGSITGLETIVISEGRFEVFWVPEDEGSKSPETLVSEHHISRRNYPEN